MPNPAFPKFLFALAFVALMALAQDPVTVPVVSTIDASGGIHGAVTLPAAGPAGNWTPVRGEAPVYAAAGWTLSHNPAFGVSCSRNGLVQAPVSFPGSTPGTVIVPDYVLSGKQISSQFWFSGDSVVCDYEFLPGT